MIWDRIFAVLATGPLFRTQQSELAEVLQKATVISDQDTHLRDHIRILSFHNRIFVQEISDRKELIIREFTDQAAAQEFVRNRLKTYDRMWDGCGCKIDYYS